MTNYVRTMTAPRVAQYGNRVAQPVVNIREDANGYALEAEVPGFTREDIEVKVEDILLTIQSIQEKEADSESPDQAPRRRGRAFRRSFVLPRDVDSAKISAEVAHGILTLSLPRREEAKARSIEIQGD